MTTNSGLTCIAALALLAIVCHATIGSGAGDASATTPAEMTNSSGDDQTLPDFDGDGTVGFGDFVIFAGVFGARQGDERYIAKYDLNADGEIGFSDFVIFAQDFGKNATSPVVTIPDANLRAAIEAALGKASDAPITQSEMKTLSRLDASNSDISDLTGLDSAGNLTYLNLNANNITDLSAMSGLINLTDLRLWKNDITDISALSGLANLKVLVAGINDITDISALSGLSKLTSLLLQYNNIVDISALSGLTNLRVLHLHYNNIKDISALAGLSKLAALGLGGTDIVDISMLSGLNNLTYLELGNNSVVDLSAVQELTKLVHLDLTTNNISDISALSGLTSLKTLGLWNNTVNDVSVLSGLNNLTILDLGNNDVTDISVLAGLTNLTKLHLQFNNISDISALRGLTDVRNLRLEFNKITDISLLSDLTVLEELELRGNPLNDASISHHIPMLRQRGVTVSVDFLRESDFDVEFVFLDSFTEKQERVLQWVANRWTSVITEDVPDNLFAKGWTGRCDDQPIEISAGEQIDDLRVYVTRLKGDLAVGRGGPILLRETTHLPVVGCISIDLERANLLITGLHEVGHVLGFGTLWAKFGFYQNPQDGDRHFNGPRAIAAFDDAGGLDYSGAKVPVSWDESHWPCPLLAGELMGPWGGASLSAITALSLADLGYGVDVSQADPYTLPGAEVAAKIAVPMRASSANRTPMDVSILNGRYVYSQGAIGDVLPHTVGDDKTVLLSAADGNWDRGATFDPEDSRQTWTAGTSARSEPELTCGAGLIREPIYVVDLKGHIVRTIER